MSMNSSREVEANIEISCGPPRPLTGPKCAWVTGLTAKPQGLSDDGGESVEQVRIASLALDPRTNQPVVLLKPLEEEPGAGLLLPDLDRPP